MKKNKDGYILVSDNKESNTNDFCGCKGTKNYAGGCGCKGTKNYAGGCASCNSYAGCNCESCRAKTSFFAGENDVLQQVIDEQTNMQYLGSNTCGDNQIANQKNEQQFEKNILDKATNELNQKTKEQNKDCFWCKKDIIIFGSILIVVLILILKKNGN